MIDLLDVVFDSSFDSTKIKTPEKQCLQGSIVAGVVLSDLRPGECHVGDA
jgi:hypothetical protein